MMKITAIIPSRYDSSRLPGKPLIDLGGKTLIQRVCEQVAKSSKITDIVVATDDQRIYDHVFNIGFNVVMTGDFESGTDRIASVAKKMDSTYVINVQGDEPLIDPQDLDDFVDHLLNSNCNISTMRHQIKDAEHLFDFNRVKVVVDDHSKVLYFSRQAIPAQRDIPFKNWLKKHDYYQHIGVYGFKREALIEVANLPLSTLEKCEKLEQLRWMESGYPISCMIVSKPSVGVDTKEDVQKVLNLILSDS